MNNPPAFLQPFLWSYDLSRMDIRTHKDIIIKNILDYGTAEATTWMKATYSEDDIKDVIAKTPRSDWSKKSISLWSMIYGVSPLHETRVFI
jgi:hypothetical protein